MAEEFFSGATGEEDLQRLGRILSECFAFPADAAKPWFESAGHENLRVLRRDGEVVGGLLLIPMAQYWGGQAVRMGGFAGVGVTPTLRGSGAATRMMEAGLAELKRRGFLLSALYPATQPLYRRVGFEQAGSHYELRCAVQNLPEGPRALPVRPFRPEDLPAVQALHASVARYRAGNLERGPYVWGRVQSLRGEAATGYLVEGARGIEGYVFLRRVQKPSGRHDLLVHDWLWATAGAAQRLLRFMRDHGSMTEELIWFGGADDSALLLLREQRCTVKLLDTWMLRVLDVAGALAARGYPRGLSARLHLKVEDPLFPENTGGFWLEVEDGTPRVRRGHGEGLRCDVRALASLFAGHRAPRALAQVGMVEGGPEALELASALFLGPPPSTPDFF